MTDLIFLGLGFAGLIALCVVLVVIGRAASDCPQIAAAARVGTIVVTTGFAAIGAGLIALIATALPFLVEQQYNGLYLALGLTAIALGLGFYSAATTLRDVLNAARPPQPMTNPPSTGDPMPVAA
ncbi:MAG: hypothetical protein AAF557_23665 [Pseudomonadota bacterium]